MAQRLRSTPPSREASCDLTPPRGRRRREASRTRPRTLLRSTPPSREATRPDAIPGLTPGVAIHAPLAGGDFIRLEAVYREHLLRSTPPSREATLSRGSVWTCGAALRSTPPSREATRDDHRHAVILEVAIHAPLAGGDVWVVAMLAMSLMLRSTPPSREATQHHGHRDPHHGVAIHAPLAGGDTSTPVGPPMLSSCDPRPPRGRRQRGQK